MKTRAVNGGWTTSTPISTGQAAPRAISRSSYGEYSHEAPSDFGSFIGRAERFVRSCDPSLELLMREWRATRTDKTTDLPWIVVMETYLRRR